MSSHLIIVDKSSSFKFDRTDLEVLTTKDYIARPELVRTRNPKIVNLSRAYSYLGAGYYCSLLAEARSHKVIPSVKTILDLSQKSIYRYALAELEELLKRRVHKMAQPPEASFTLYSFFGSADDRRFQDLTRRTFDLFRCPMLKIQIRLKEDWHIHSLQPLVAGRSARRPGRPFPRGAGCLYQDELAGADGEAGAPLHHGDPVQSEGSPAAQQPQVASEVHQGGRIARHHHRAGGEKGLSASCGV